jgi:hypothetical protein
MKEVPVGRSHKALVDDRDYDLVIQHRWTYHRYGARTSDLSESKALRTYMHRFILGLTDSEVRVRFLNGNVLDCQRKNMLVQRRSHIVRNKQAEYTIFRSAAHGAKYHPRKPVAKDD